jgi:hypothetical protein
VVIAALSWFSAAAHEATGGAAHDDLNLLLRLLSQDVRIGQVQFARPIDPLWIKDIRELQSSSSAVVAETARAVEDSAKTREEALKVLETAEAKNKQLVEDNPVDIGDAIIGLLPHGVSDEDLDELERIGRITRSEAQAYRARRAAEDNALMTFAGVALRSYVNSYMADGKVRLMRRQAEVLEAKALAEHLVPALRARAGAKRDDLPVRIVVGIGADRQHAIRFLPTLISTSAEPLTQFTLLMDIRAPDGRRRAVAYIPRLEPGRGVQVAPASYDFQIERPEDGGPKVSKTVVRHTVWCDQFTFEGEEVPIMPASLKEANAAYCAVACDKGCAYFFSHTGRGRDESNYSLEFTEWTPAKDVYHVKGKLSFYESIDRDKPPKVTTVEGTIRGVDGPPPTPYHPEGVKAGVGKKAKAAARNAATAKLTPDAELIIGSGVAKCSIDLFITESGRIDWRPRTGPLHDRAVSTLEDARNSLKIRADFFKNQRILNESRRLASDGKTEEAAQMLNDYIATDPGENWVADARYLLKELDKIAAEGAQEKKGRKFREGLLNSGKSPRKPGMTNPKSRPGSKPQTASPPNRS